MRKLMNKKLNKKGFTLMEMLIVVAIIAILVAIAIPTYSNSMKKANAAVDAANIRSGYATLMANIMLDNAYKADATYTLQGDGTVVKDGTTGYTCKASSTDAADGSTNIGGVTATWTKDQSVKYTVEDGKIKTIAP